MGVDYRSGVAKGYIIPGEDLYGIAATKYEQTGLDGEIIDYLYERNYLICLNAYISEPEYILGYDVCPSSEGGAQIINDIKSDPVKDAEVEEIYKQFFSDDGAKPQLMCYLSVT